MGNKITGKNGSVTFDTGYVLHVKSWTIDYIGDVIDTSDFVDSAAGYRTFLPGVTSWSGSYEATLDESTGVTGPGADPASATFTAASGRTYIGNIIVTSVSPSLVFDGEATVSISFQGTAGLSVN